MAKSELVLRNHISNSTKVRVNKVFDQISLFFFNTESKFKQLRF